VALAAVAFGGGSGDAQAAVTAGLRATAVATCDGTTTVTLHIDAQDPAPPEQAADLAAVVVGASGTRLDEVESALVPFAANAVVSPYGNHLGVVEAGPVARNETPTDGAAVGGLLTDTSAAQNAILSMTANPGTPDVAGALGAAATMLGGPGSRPQAPKTVIVITGAVVDDAAVSAADALRRAGTRVLVATDAAVDPSFVALAGDAEDVFSASTLDAALDGALAAADPAATNFSFTAAAGSDWTVTGASATAGAASFDGGGVKWSLPLLESVVSTGIDVTYTLRHTSTSRGLDPLGAATLTYADAAGNAQRVVLDQAVPVSCNQAPVAVILTPDQVALEGARTAQIVLDGAASSDPDGDPLTYSWTTDDPSVAAIPATPNPTVAFGAGDHRVRLTVSDGELTSSAEITIDVYDPTGPEVTPRLSSPLPASGWYRSNVTVSFDVADPESDVTSESASCAGVTVSADTAGQVVACTAHSGGGDTTGSVVIRRDSTGPTLSFGGNAGSYGVADDVSISCSAADALSGVASGADCGRIAAPAWTFGAGAQAIARTATDVAGNTTVSYARFNVVVDAAGLCALLARWADGTSVAHALCVKIDPTNMQPFWNDLAAQAGKHIPVDKAAIIQSLSLSLR
jgi:hypothetical protein